MKKFQFLKAFCSPFKAPKIKFYIGKLAIGTPYFFPRKWVPNPEKPGYEMAVPKKIGFDVVDLGWKTKFGDYRFEWSPLISFVLFKWQIAIIFKAPHEDQYWESWLYYELDTDKSLSKTERIEQCKRDYPQIWTRHSKEGSETIDYYDLILRKKYLKK
jgi:hypothetical protein